MKVSDLVLLGFVPDPKFGKYGIYVLIITHTDLIRVQITVQSKDMTGYISIQDPWENHIMHRFPQPATQKYLESIINAAKTLFDGQ